MTIAWEKFYPAGWFNKPLRRSAISGAALNNYDAGMESLVAFVNGLVDPANALRIPWGMESDGIVSDYDPVAMTGTDNGPALQALADTGVTHIYVKGKIRVASLVLVNKNDGSTSVQKTLKIIGTSPKAEIILDGTALPTVTGYLLDSQMKWAFLANVSAAAVSGSVVDVGTSLGTAKNAVRTSSLQNPGVVFDGMNCSAMVRAGVADNVGLIFSQGKAVEIIDMHAVDVKVLVANKLYTDSAARFRNVYLRQTTATIPGMISLAGCTVTSGSTTVLCATVSQATHGHMPITPGNGIPPGCFVSNVVDGVSFQLGRQFQSAAGGGKMQATASYSGALTVGMPFAWMFVQQISGDNIKYDGVKCGGLAGFGWHRENGGLVLNGGIGGGFYFIHCSGVKLINWHREQSQNMCQPGVYMDRSKVTVDAWFGNRGANSLGQHAFYINDDLTGTTRPLDGSELILNQPHPRWYGNDNSIAPDLASAADVYLYALSKSGKVVVLGNSASINSSGSTTDSTDGLLIDSADATVLTGLNVATWGSRVGLLGGDFQLSYASGAWGLAAIPGPRAIPAQAVPTLAAVTASGNKGELTPATTYSYCVAALDDDGLTTACSAEQDYTTPAAYTATVAAGSDGVDVANIGTSISTLSVSSVPGSSPGTVIVVTTLSDGSAGTALIAYTSTGSGVLNGCSISAGTGVINTGNAVTEPLAAQLLPVVTAPLTSLIVWRKAATGVTTAPDAYCVIPMRSVATVLSDTGTCLNGRPWLAAAATPFANPSTLATTSTKTRFPRLSVDWTVLSSAASPLTNTTTRTQMALSPIYPPSLVGAGFSGRLRIGGAIEGKITSGTYTLSIWCNNVSIATIIVAASQTAATTSAVAWFVDLDVLVDVAGASGKISVVGQTNGVSAAGAVSNVAPTRSLLNAVDLSGGAQFEVRAQMATADAANKFYVDRVTLRGS